MAPSALLASHKRVSRSDSSNQLFERQEPALKRQERPAQNPTPAALLPLLAHQPGETLAAFFRRLGARLRRDIFSVAHAFDRDGLYIYKRPVRSGAGTEKGALLASCGSVFHHVVVYVKQGDQLTALEYGPANEMDITDNFLVDTPPGPVLLRPAPEPEPQCLPMLHVAAPHHSLEAEHVQRALEFAQAGRYHALRSNCIAFADFAVRVLTGGAVRGAPLAFDLLAGQVPAADPPLLGLLSLLQMSWHDVCDGARMLAGLLAAVPGGALPPPPGAEALGPLVEPAADECAEAAPTLAAAPALPAAAANPWAAMLAAFLPPQPLAAAPAGASPAESDSSASSEDTCAAEAATPSVIPSSTAPSASLAAATAVSSGSSLASTGDSLSRWGGAKGPQLPARRAR